jgi:hypothetical protein
MNIEERLELLEKENKKMKMMNKKSFGIVIGFIMFCFGGSLLTQYYALVDMFLLGLLLILMGVLMVLGNMFGVQRN